MKKTLMCLMILTLLGCGEENRPISSAVKNTSTQNVVSRQEAAMLASMQKDEDLPGTPFAKENQPAANQHPGKPAWKYMSTQDDMRGETLLAILDSRTTVNLPTDGTSSGKPVHLRLVLRKSPVYGKDIFFSLPGQTFNCHFKNCTVYVKFDDDKVWRVMANPLGGKQNDAVFIKSTARFFSKLKTSAQLMVEIELVNQGTHQFTFDVNGLTVDWWPVRKKEKTENGQTAKQSSKNKTTSKAEKADK